ncbi:MAG: hypothetical protein KBC02_00615 [Candidatus Pacebacteria bacterium]|nr:hypothetical protein [Candidatus Paceibacterota bacterium]
MENTPKGNQGSEEEVLIAEDGMTDAEARASLEREKRLLKIQELAKEKNISDDVLQQILDTVDEPFNNDGDFSGNINGIQYRFHPKWINNRRFIEVEFNGSMNIEGLDHSEKKELDDAFCDKYYQVVREAYGLKLDERSASKEVQHERLAHPELKDDRFANGEQSEALKGKLFALKIKKLL